MTGRAVQPKTAVEAMVMLAVGVTQSAYSFLRLQLGVSNRGRIHRRISGSVARETAANQLALVPTLDKEFDCGVEGRNTFRKAAGPTDKPRRTMLEFRIDCFHRVDLRLAGRDQMKATLVFEAVIGREII